MLRSFLLLFAMMLVGCTAPAYWHEPPGPATPDDTPEQWQGVLRSGALRYYAFTPLGTPVTVRCAGYQDLINLERKGDQLNVKVGKAEGITLDLGIDAEGRFSTVVPIKADTWVYGGVMLFDESPVLHLWGELNSESGLGQGRINVSPGDERFGCPGRFQVSRNGGAPPQEMLDAPFKAQYWIDELDRRDDWLLFGWPRRPFGRP